MIYLDMDGVLADFDAGVAAAGATPNWSEMDIPREKMTPAQLARDDQIRAVMGTPGFFENLPVMHDAHVLWDFCERWKPVVLTARPRREEYADQVAREKRAWIEKTFGAIPDDRFICTLASKKQEFIGHKPGRVQILVDDRQSNCTNWAASGGKAVLHLTADESVRDITSIMRGAGIWSWTPVLEAV